MQSDVESEFAQVVREKTVGYLRVYKGGHVEGVGSKRNRRRPLTRVLAV